MLPNRADFRVPLNRSSAWIDSCRTVQTPISVGGQEPFPAQPCHLRCPDKVPFGTALVPAFIPCANRMSNLRIIRR